MNKFEVNAALWKMVNGEDVEASSAVVIEFGRTLKQQAPVSFEAKTTSEEKTDITGQTLHGNVSVTEEGEKTREFSFGSHKTRIGHFKMWKQGSDEIWFHHFWKSDEATAGGESQVKEYRIKYNARSLKLEHFGIRKEIQLFSFFVIHITAGIIEPLWGSGRKLSSLFFTLGSAD